MYYNTAPLQLMCTYVNRHRHVSLAKYYGIFRVFLVYWSFASYHVKSNSLIDHGYYMKCNMWSWWCVKRCSNQISSSCNTTWTQYHYLCSLGVEKCLLTVTHWSIGFGMLQSLFWNGYILEELGKIYEINSIILVYWKEKCIFFRIFLWNFVFSLH